MTGAADPRPAWSPLFEGERAREALGVARDIAAALRDAPPTTLPGLAGGSAGIAVLEDALFQLDGDDACASRAMAHVERALTPARGPRPAGLFSGFAGAGFVTQQLSGRLFDLPEGEPDPLDAIDEAIVELLAEERPLNGEYDLISGLVGLALYLVERMPRPTARSGLSRIVALLQRSADLVATGLTWHHPARLLPVWRRAQYPDGWFNCGLAHGVPGVVAACAAIAGAGVEPTRCAALAGGAVSWLLAQRQGEGAGSVFPFCVAPGAAPESPALGWCYGDPGVVSALVVAGRAWNDARWVDAAVEVGLRMANRRGDAARLVDCSLCHGSAGTAHIYHRLYRATGEPRFAEEALHWFDVTLARRRPGVGLGGYLAQTPVPGDARRSVWGPEPGLLTGSAGIALALIAAASSVEPTWDRALLLSVARPVA